MERITSDKKCPHCNHPGCQHFEAEDTIGWWAFCVLADCPCFVEDRKDEERP